MSPKRQSRDKPVRVAGRYALFDRIASGGMASVHLGRQMGDAGFARTVAIKRMRHALVDDPRLIAMFVDEARLAGRVQHPNVVTTIDVVHDHGELFLVMEYVHGVSLKSLTNTEGKIVSPPPEISAAVAYGALRGLHAAHEAKGEGGVPLGIVHRDVSPQNILVSGDGTTRVVDFGVAKAAGRIQKTATGQLKGKPRYMAPEQITDKRDIPVDRRTDIFGMATVLWELLAGKRLFDDVDDLEVLRKIMSMPITSPREHNEAVPSALALAVLKGLDRDPTARFDTARDFARAIEAAMPRGIVSQDTVGEWVGSIAGERLAEVERRILEIEHAAPSDEWKGRDVAGARDAARPESAPPSAPGTADTATGTLPDFSVEGTETNVVTGRLLDREDSSSDDTAPSEETDSSNGSSSQPQSTADLEQRPQPGQATTIKIVPTSPSTDGDVVDLSADHQADEDDEAHKVTRRMEPRQALREKQSTERMERSESTPGSGVQVAPRGDSRARNLAVFFGLLSFVLMIAVVVLVTRG